MKNIIFIAPPAAGKGTQSDLLISKYGYEHISTGDLLREEVASGSELGLSISELMKSGALISDDIVNKLLVKALSATTKPFILDGYPRNISQAEKLDILLSELGKSADAVIYLEVDEELAMKRATGRISCPNCKRSYHKYFMKPKQDNICDNCGATLISRADDTEEAFKNRYNTYVQKEYTEEDICEQYMTMYKALMLSNTNEAYKYLDNEYRNLKYGSLQEYKDFIISNNDDINDFEMKAYSINENRYVCKDGKDNFYIFNVNKVLDYTVVLDTYTVDLPEFTEKYNKVSAQEKVALNINKVITALNYKDYKYIYNKLADSFKDNYFNNEEELKEYLSNKLYDNNEINFGKFSDEGNGIYTYQIELSEISNENEAAQEGKGDNFARIKMNIVMQLKEGTDFVMSFSIE